VGWVARPNPSLNSKTASQLAGRFEYKPFGAGPDAPTQAAPNFTPTAVEREVMRFGSEGWE